MENTIVYDDKSWTFLTGALQTVDRSYGYTLDTLMHNITNGQTCNIYDKTQIVKYSSDNLLSDFDHLFGHAVSGRWHLIARDTDPLASGSISEWKLIVTYIPDET